MDRGRLWVLGELLGFGSLAIYIWHVDGRCLPELLSFHPWESTATLFAYVSFATLVIELTAAAFVKMSELLEHLYNFPQYRRQPVLAQRRLSQATQAIGAPRLWNSTL